MKLVSIDRKALEPMEPVKPRKALIVLLGLLLGGILGVLIVLVRNFLAVREGQLKNPTALRAPASLTSTASSGKDLQHEKI